LNPVLVGQGAKSCACVSGILSVNPAGDLLPCSSFGEGLGSLLTRSFTELYESRAARYWRDREYVPPPCRGCPDVDVCAGACPLYWDAAGSFDELPCAGAGDAAARRAWEERRVDGKSFGVPAPACAAGEG
jgi:radical SAM protein with 4Fe4S-binding SPASM domain